MKVQLKSPGRHYLPTETEKLIVLPNNSISADSGDDRKGSCGRESLWGGRRRSNPDWNCRGEREVEVGTTIDCKKKEEQAIYPFVLDLPVKKILTHFSC